MIEYKKEEKTYFEATTRKYEKQQKYETRKCRKYKRIQENIWYSQAAVNVQEGDQNNWISQYESNINNCVNYYITSFYFSVITITSVGYGDYHPVSRYEQCLIILLTIISCVHYAYTISVIGDIMLKLNYRKLEFQKRLGNINQYIQTHEISSTLKIRAQSYLKYIFDLETQQNNKSADQLNGLSMGLKEEIINQVYKKSLNNIQFIQKNFSEGSINQLCKCVQEKIYGTDEFVVNSSKISGNQISDAIKPQLYYIFQGQVEICHQYQSQNGEIIERKIKLETHI